MKRKILQLLFIIILLLTGCGTGFESVSEYNERIQKEADEQQEILGQNNASSSVSNEEDSIPVQNVENEEIHASDYAKQDKQNDNEADTNTAGNNDVDSETKNQISNKKDTDKKTENKKKQNQTKDKKRTDTEKKDAKTKDKKKDKNKEKEATTESKTESKTTEEKSEYITISVSINCAGVFSHANYKNDNSLPTGGIILSSKSIAIRKGDSVFTALQTICSTNGIQLSYTGSGASVYINAINHLAEKQYGKFSGWMYKVNEKSPNMGIGAYVPSEGDQVEIYYTTSS